MSTSIKERWDNGGVSRPMPRKETSMRVWVVRTEDAEKLTHDELNNPEQSKLVKQYEEHRVRGTVERR